MEFVKELAERGPAGAALLLGILLEVLGISSQFPGFERAIAETNTQLPPEDFVAALATGGLLIVAAGALRLFVHSFDLAAARLKHAEERAAESKRTDELKQLFENNRKELAAALANDKMTETQRSEEIQKILDQAKKSIG